MEGIQVSIEKVGTKETIAVIKVGGYIDTTTSAELEHSLSTVLKSSCYNIIIDLGNVDYISSAGWGIFISEIKGIRENSGDLKLVRMIPDVYEVFELLEFHYILKAFDTLEEAIKDFEKSGVPVSEKISMPFSQPDKPAQSSGGGNTVGGATGSPGRSGVAAGNVNSESVKDKVRQIVVEKPEAGAFQIAKFLNTPRFGNIKLGWFEVRKYLKQMNLESKKKRVAYFKQKSFG
jgi:anti-sigma B factor antagonist